MDPTPPLTDDIYAEKVRRARATPLAEKLLAGPRLHRVACEAMRAGIRALHPAASDAEVERMLAARLATARRIEEAARG
jgi:hypothetical protein